MSRQTRPRVGLGVLSFLTWFWAKPGWDHFLHGLCGKREALPPHSMTSTTSLKCLNRKKNVIQPGCPGPSRTITVAPQLSMGARWARGAHGFCAFDFVVGVGGALLPCKPLPRAVAGDMERRLFVTAIRCARAPTRDTHATCDAHAPHHALRAAPRLTRPPDRRARAGTSKRSRSARGRT